MKQIVYLTVMVTRSDLASCKQVGGDPEDVTGQPGVSLFVGAQGNGFVPVQAQRGSGVM
jgi:hypothetical protein